ncbi:MAG: SUMF1/EgtB/PvdO family nonheme iron enzyme [Anaerolineales bacterium]
MGYIFISYSHKDRDYVHKLQDALQTEGFEVWIDDRIDYGDEWLMVIQDQLDACDAFVVVASENSYKSKWVQKEVTRAQRINKPFFPLLLSGNPWLSIESTQYVDVKDKSLPPERFYKRLAKVTYRNQLLNKVEPVIESKPVVSDDNELDLFRFMEIPIQKYSQVIYPFWIGKYPITNAQYERFLNATDFANPVYWLEFPKFDENCQPMGDWGKQGLDWLQAELKKAKSKVLLPLYWNDKVFGRSNPDHPVVGISWYEASAYCKWLFQNWNVLSESNVNPLLKPQAIRLPLEIEWVIAAGGENPNGRYPWDKAGKVTTSLKEILRRANVYDRESGIVQTTPVNSYPLGKSHHGVMDMAGNVLEWQVNYWDEHRHALVLRGGSWSHRTGDARVASRLDFNIYPNYGNFFIGFRVCAITNG